MTQVIAVNGSPRKGWNTWQLLQCALEGARSAGAETKEIINLYELNFKGCVSCFYCKLKIGGQPGKCALHDDLSEVLERVWASDVLFLGSPIYLWDVTGAMRSFLERLMFPNLAYRPANRSEFKGKLNVGFIYTMNVTSEKMESQGYDFLYKSHMSYLACLNGKTEYMTANDTYQFDDYSKFNASLFDPILKARVREEQFPKDRRRAFALGAGMVPQ
ncbi:MAG: flavodoxin family protein [Synergistaceae bacterium]|nr:flavodoxin family protein [Synergistaceae bacterium]